MKDNYRMYQQAFETLDENQDIIKDYDIIQPFNKKVIGGIYVQH